MTIESISHQVNKSFIRPFPRSSKTTLSHPFYLLHGRSYNADFHCRHYRQSECLQAKPVSKAAALYTLKKIRTLLATAVSTDEEPKAHRANLQFLIEKALKAD